MNNVTFHDLGEVAATTIPGSNGSKAWRVSASCFPDSQTYWFRAHIATQETELQPLNPKDPPPIKNGCCASVPNWVEVTAILDGRSKRVVFNCNSLAKRCTIAKGSLVTAAEVYNACVEKRLQNLLLEIGLPALRVADAARHERWESCLGRALMYNPNKEAIVAPVMQFIATHWRAWQQECDQKELPSLFFPAEKGRKCDIEYFRDGAIFVYYVEKNGTPVGINLTADTVEDFTTNVNPVWREIRDLKKFLVYKACAERFQKSTGIITIYRTSEYPELNRYHVLHERSKSTLQDFLSNEIQLSRPPPVSAKGKGGKPFRLSGTFKKKEQPSPWAKYKIFLDLLEGLATLHRSNISHRSFQPSAIDITPEGDSPVTAKIGHFDFSCITSGDNGPVDTDLKPPFLPPELGVPDKGKVVYPKDSLPCDVYNLGECMKQLFEIKEFKPGPELLLDPQSPEENIARLIRKMQFPDPAMRPSAEKALQILKAMPVVDPNVDPIASVLRRKKTRGSGKLNQTHDSIEFDIKDG